MFIYNETRNHNKLQIKKLTKYHKYNEIQKNSIIFVLINCVTHIYST